MEIENKQTGRCGFCGIGLPLIYKGAMCKHCGQNTLRAKLNLIKVEAKPVLIKAEAKSIITLRPLVPPIEIPKQPFQSKRNGQIIRKKGA